MLGVDKSIMILGAGGERVSCSTRAHPGFTRAAAPPAGQGHAGPVSGDVAHIQDSISCCVGMPAGSGTTDAIESLKKLKLLRSQPTTTVCVNHDIDDWNRLRVNGRQVV
jgi:hypothetical protein